MSRCPAGPKLKSIGETSRDVPAPLLQNLALAINCIVLFFACLLLTFLNPRDIETFSPLESAGIAAFGVLGSTACIWSISASRSYSRPLILLNTVGVSATCLLIYFGKDTSTKYAELLIAVGIVAAPTIWVLYMNDAVSKYYKVVSGKADRSILSKVSEAQAKAMDKAAAVVDVVAELFIVLLAILVIAFPYFWFGV